MPRTGAHSRETTSFIHIPPIRTGAELVRVALTAAAAAGVVLMHGFVSPPAPFWLISCAQILLMAGYWTDVLVRQRRGTEPLPDRRLDWTDAAMAGLFVVGIAVYAFLPGRGAWIIAETAIVWTLLAELWRLYTALSRQLARPGVLMPLSFLLLIGVGTVLLKTPVASSPRAAEPLSWLDAAFTITSAVCVTGLTVRDTAHDFSPLGQTIIGVFIQLGGLGIIVFGSMLVHMVGHAFSMRGERHLSQMLQDEPIDRLRRSTRYLVLGTILIQLAGAAAMYPLWRADACGPEPLSATRRAGLSLFHAVSAFCNAGFDTLGTSLMPYRHAAITHAVIAPLIVLGGLGFPALHNIARVARARLRALQWPNPMSVRVVAPARRPIARLSVHTRIVLFTTVGLYLWGLLTIGAAQLLDSQGLPPETNQAQSAPADPAYSSKPTFFATLADASFMAISARTAGFNSLPMSELAPASRFSLITLMIVGGSPGGAAGGFKTTVLAVLLLSVIATIRQRRETEIFKRSIADSLVRQAGTIAICYILLIVVSTMLLLLTEQAPFGVVFFEAVSAATTTGLSLGLTPQLSPLGKVVIILTMFLGRVGPLALFASLAFGRGPQRPYAYPHESIALG